MLKEPISGDVQFGSLAVDRNAEAGEFSYQRPNELLPVTSCAGNIYGYRTLIIY